MTTDINNNGLPTGYITVEEAAKMLNINMQSVRKAINRGTIKGAIKTKVPISYKVIVIPRVEVERYATNRRKKKEHEKTS